MEEEQLCALFGCDRRVARWALERAKGVYADAMGLIVKDGPTLKAKKREWAAADIDALPASRRARPAPRPAPEVQAGPRAAPPAAAAKAVAVVAPPAGQRAGTLKFVANAASTSLRDNVIGAPLELFVGETYVIGRHTSCALRIKQDLRLSKRHCAVAVSETKTGEFAFVIENTSTNGVRLRAHRRA